MSDFFDLIPEYFWLIGLIFGAFGYRRAVRKIEQSPSDSGINKDEARIYLRRFALGMELPWIVMGFGKILGFTPTVSYYFRPQDGNPFVIAWLGVIFITACVYAWWVLLADGARKTREFSLMEMFGQRGSKPQPEWLIKLLAALGPFFVLFWIYMAMSMDATLPK